MDNYPPHEFPLLPASKPLELNTPKTYNFFDGEVEAVVDIPPGRDKGVFPPLISIAERVHI